MGGHNSGGLFPGTSGGRAPKPSQMSPTSTGSKEELIAEAQAKGLGIDPDKVVGITRNSDGKIVWLETGKGGERGSGLSHIVENHGGEFEARGISDSKIPEYIISAVSTGNIVGRQGTRPIYEFTYNGTRQRVAVTVSDNGYIVGANLRPTPKEG